MFQVCKYGYKKFYAIQSFWYITHGIICYEMGEVTPKPQNLKDKDKEANLDWQENKHPSKNLRVLYELSTKHKW